LFNTAENMPMNKTLCLVRFIFFYYFIILLSFGYEGRNKSHFLKKTVLYLTPTVSYRALFCRPCGIRVSEADKNKKVWHITYFFCGRLKTEGFVSIVFSNYQLFACCVQEINILRTVNFSVLLFVKI